MTLEEVYAKIVQHQIKGLMIHEQLAQYYDFLGLKGYKRCHEYHFIEENCVYRSTVRYYINHHNKLVNELQVENPKVIPDSWYKYERKDVDISTKQNAVKSGITIWVNWEKDTKDFYETMYQELMEIGEIASAFKVKELICGVDKELKIAERHHIELLSISFNMDYIVSIQQCLHNKYKKKLKHIGIELC